jgi:Tol biopolymer transport system component
MLTGNRAFPELSAAEREPPALDTSPSIKRVVNRCLAKDPDQRFQNALDLKAALIWAASEPTVAADAAKKGRGWWTGAAACLLAAAALVAWAGRRPTSPTADERVLRLSISPPEKGRFALDGNAGGMAISPDGKRIAYVAATEGKTALWIRQLDGFDARLLPGTEAAERPFWSPDGKNIAFFAGKKLFRVDLAGGLPLTICDAPGFDRSGTWSSGGQILFSMTWQGLQQVPASGGTPTTLTLLDTAKGETSHRWPQALPGGRFLYWGQGSTEEQSKVYASSLGKPDERLPLTTSAGQAIYAAGYLLWPRDGTLVAQPFDIDRLRLSGDPRPVAGPIPTVGMHGQINVTEAAGILVYFAGASRSQLTWFDRSGRPLGAVGEPHDYKMFRLSYDGRRVASILGGMVGGTDLWLLGGSGGLHRLTFDPGLHWSPIWSPGDRSIIFSSGSPLNLIRKQASGAGVERRLTQSSNAQHPTDWSRDGRFVLYYEFAPDTKRDLWVLPVTPDGNVAGAPRVYLRTPFNELVGYFSPEPQPRWVTYVSDESGRYEVYVQAFPEARSKRQISTGGGRFPAWGARGEEIFYLTPDSKLMAVATKLRQDSVEASAPLELFALPSGEVSIFPYDVAQDGTRFLVATVPSPVADPLSVIVNWPALVQQRAPAEQEP